MSECSCGNDSVHPVGSRRTSDNVRVTLWSNGKLTEGPGHYYINGLPRDRDAAMAVGWLVLADVALYDRDEVGCLVAAAKWAHARGYDAVAMRAKVEKGHALPVIKPSWTTISANRDGRPTIQAWKLPLLFWPGLCVWRESGRYSVLREVERRSGAYENTGFSFGNLRELTDWLNENREV